MNAAIAEEGLRHPYGGEIGRTLMAGPGEKDVRVRAMGPGRRRLRRPYERLRYAGGY